MICKTTNGLGQEVTWYSEDEVKHLNDLLNQALKELEELQEVLDENKHNI